MREMLCFGVLVIILVNISPGLAIRCYHCEDVLGQGLHCESNVKEVLQPNCTEGFVCIKYTYRTNNATNTIAVHRNCAPSSKCEELRASLPELGYCGTCPTSLCNSAPASHLVAPLWSQAVLSVLTCVGLYQFRPYF